MSEEETSNYEQQKLKKKKKLPSFGSKKNRSSDPEVEKEELVAILFKQKELMEEQRIEKSHLLIEAEWDSFVNEAKITKNSGQSLEVFGHHKDKHVYLYPEETLYLIEMNKLKLLYNGIRLSIQRSYSVIMNPLSSLTIETFKIYKHFLIHGFKLFRNEILAHFNEENTEIKDVQTTIQIFSTPTIEDFVQIDFPKIIYDVYRPNTNVKKSLRQKPHYYLCIINPKEKLWNLMNLVSRQNNSNLIFASVIGNTVSIFNIEGVQIPDLFNYNL